MLRTFAKKTIQQLGRERYKPLNRIELRKESVLHNVVHIQQLSPGCSVIPVLKGNAYGHGIEQVAKILNGADCAMLAVDGYFEAQKLRAITKHRILVMGYILAENIPLLDTKKCSFVVQDIAGLHAFGQSSAKQVRVHAELNTGMNRLGLTAKELDEYLQVLTMYPNLRLEGVMSHLADADNDADETFNDSQIQTFDAQMSRILAQGFKPSLVHIAQTAGSAKTKSTYANAIRTGIGLYGINPLLKSDPQFKKLSPLQPVLQLKGTVIKVIDLNKGDTVSYSCTFTAPRPMRVGVLPLGYYEGVPRELSNKGVATINGKELPIVGRVCMNHTIINLDGTDLRVNDEVTVISSDKERANSVMRIESDHGLFAYTTLTGLSSSIRREII